MNTTVTFIELAGLAIIILLCPYYSALTQIDYYEMPPAVLDLPICRGNGDSSSPHILCLLWLRKSGKYFGGDQKCKQSDTKGFDNLDHSYTAVYILVTLSAITLVGWERTVIVGSTTCNCCRKSFWQDGYSSPSAIALFATSNTVLMMLISGSRIIYGM